MLKSQSRKFLTLPPAHHYGSIGTSCRFAELFLAESRYTKHFETPRHIHERDCLVIFLHGVFREEFKTCSIDCTAGTILFRPAAEVHCDRVGSTGARCLIIELPPSLRRRIGEVGLRQDAPMKAGDIDGIRWKLHKELLFGDELSPLVVESLVFELICRLNRANREKLQAPRWLKLADDYIHSNFQSVITLRGVAAAAGVHPAHLARVFTQQHGRTVGEYVRYLRVESASDALQFTNHTLAEIALTAGFSNQSHFSKVFRSLAGLTPGQYRRATRECNLPTISQRM